MTALLPDLTAEVTGARVTEAAIRAALGDLSAAGKVTGEVAFVEAADATELAVGDVALVTEEATA